MKKRALVRWKWMPMLSLAFASLVVLFIGASPASASVVTCAKPSGTVTTFHTAFINGRMSFGNAEATDLSAKACGAVTGKPGAMVLTVQPGDIKFATVTVKLFFISLLTTITANAPLSGPFIPGHEFTSAKVHLATNLSASVKILGFSCAIDPLTLKLTTGKSGSMQGTTFTGSQKKGFTGKVVANDFTVPAIHNSASCPWLIAKLANLLAGLPVAPGDASISMEGSITTP